MKPSTSAEGWSQFHAALRAGQPEARLRLLATVSALVSYADRALAPERRTELCERIAASVAARVCAHDIRSPADLLRSLDGELTRRLRWRAAGGLAPSAALLARLGDSLAALPAAQQRALAAYYGPTPGHSTADAGARRQGLAALRGSLGLDPR